MGSIIAAIIGGFAAYQLAPSAMHILAAQESSRAARKYAEMLDSGEIDKRRKAKAAKEADNANG